MAKQITPNEPSPDIFYNVDCLHQALYDSGYICSHDFTSKVMTSIHTKPVRGAFLYGMAGTGKSYLPMVLAKVLDRQLLYINVPKAQEKKICLSKLCRLKIQYQA